MTPSILAFDCSSKAIGWCLYNGVAQARGVIRLDPKADIGKRCLAAKRAIEELVMRYPVDAVTIESPVCRFAKAIIPQVRVQSMILLACAEQNLAWCEVSPTAGKKALAEDGDATKREMLEAAAPYFGYAAPLMSYRCFREEWAAYAGGVVIYTEHEADALGLALVMQGKVEVVA
jgi:Holliday junction resolvasome RuvABC endonuclease subunit